NPEGRRAVLGRLRADLRRARPPRAAVAPALACRWADAACRSTALRHHRRLRHRWRTDRDLPRVLRSAGPQRRAVVPGAPSLAIRAVTRDTQRRYPVGEMLEARFGLDAPRRNQLARLTEIALTFALIICALPFLMLQWGYSSADIRDGFKALFFGIEIGQFRI